MQNLELIRVFLHPLKTDNAKGEERQINHKQTNFMTILSDKPLNLYIQHVMKRFNSVL